MYGNVWVCDKDEMGRRQIDIVGNDSESLDPEVWARTWGVKHYPDAIYFLAELAEVGTTEKLERLTERVNDLFEKLQEALGNPQLFWAVNTVTGKWKTCKEEHAAFMAIAEPEWIYFEWDGRE